MLTFCVLLAIAAAQQQLQPPQFSAIQSILVATGANECFTVSLSATCVSVADLGRCSFGAVVDAVCVNSTVTALTLRSLNISGTVPSDIGVLTGLSSLTLAALGLHGDVPSQLGLLTNLKQLRLFRNNLVSLPTELARLTQLTDVYIDRNLFRGVPRLPNIQYADRSCIIQSSAADESNCFDCSTAPATCVCSDRFACNTSTTVVMSPTTAAATTTTTAASATSTAPLTTSRGSVPPMLSSASPPSSSVDLALIVGASVGGVAGLAVIGLVVFLVLRRRKPQAQPAPPASTAIYSSAGLATPYEHGRLE